MIENEKKKRLNFGSKRYKILMVNIFGLQLVLSVIFLVHMIGLDLLPGNFILLLVFGLLILLAITVCSQFVKESRISTATRIGGLVFALAISVVMGIGCIYLGRTEEVIETVVVTKEENYKVDNLVVAVHKDDIAEGMDDALLYNFGIQKNLDRANTDQVIQEIQENSGIELSVKEYDDFSSMIRDFKKDNIQALIYNTAYDDTIEEIEKDFTDEIRILNSNDIKTKLDFTASDINVTQEPFTVYISGIDVYGEIAKTSRSDVNMLVTINPKTKEVLMTNTPRDYFVLLPEVSGTYRDKLTHAGIYGIQCSMDTLSYLYGINIDYYVRVNFTTLKNLVNALGGVNVYSEYEFTTHYKNGGYDIKKGYNFLNGKQALAFSRERYNLPGGDEQRGKNQQAVLKALMEQVMSPSVLVGYLGIMDSLDGNFETNISMNQIASLVKMQLSDRASWTFKTQSVTGRFGQEATFSGGRQRLSIIYEDFGSVLKARNKLLSVGARPTEDEEGRFSEENIEKALAGKPTTPGAPAGQPTKVDLNDDSDEIGIDSSLGEFANNPTIQGESGLKENYDYYNTVQESVPPKESETESETESAKESESKKESETKK